MVGVAEVRGSAGRPSPGTVSRTGTRTKFGISPPFIGRQQLPADPLVAREERACMERETRANPEIVVGSCVRFPEAVVVVVEGHQPGRGPVGEARRVAFAWAATSSPPGMWPLATSDNRQNVAFLCVVMTVVSVVTPAVGNGSPTISFDPDAGRDSRIRRWVVRVATDRTGAASAHSVRSRFHLGSALSRTSLATALIFFPR